MDYSFASEPLFDIRANPVGHSAAADMPGLVAALRAQLLKVGAALRCAARWGWG
jgi:hypothetical protein